MKSKKDQRGFILVEFIISLILIGIIGVFTSLFIYTGVKGYIDARDYAEASLKAQVALDRIRLELRDINDVTSINDTNPYSITYTSDNPKLMDTRTIKFTSSAGAEENKIYIRNETTGAQNILLDKVPSFTLAMGTANLDGISDSKGEVSNIEVTFTMENIGKIFKADIYPRNMVKEP